MLHGKQETFAFLIRCVSGTHSSLPCESPPAFKDSAHPPPTLLRFQEAEHVQVPHPESHAQQGSGQPLRLSVRISPSATPTTVAPSCMQARGRPAGPRARLVWEPNCQHSLACELLSSEASGLVTETRRRPECCPPVRLSRRHVLGQLSRLVLRLVLYFGLLPPAGSAIGSGPPRNF